MKTSYILLAIIAFVTLTGMITVDMLLKQQYDKIDWANPYQAFEQRLLPTVSHWVVEGTPNDEIVVVQTIDKPQVLIAPGKVKFYRIRQQGDTAFVAFTPDYSGYQNDPRDVADRELSVQVVLQLPNPQFLQVKNGRVTLREIATDKLFVSLQNSRLRTNKLKVSDSFALTASQHSFAVFGSEDHYKLLQTVLQDSSGVQLNNTQTDEFIKELSPKAEIQLRGRAVKWLK